MAIDFMPKHKGYAALYPKHVSNDSRWKPIYCTLFENYQRKVSKNQCQKLLASPAHKFFVLFCFSFISKSLKKDTVWKLGMNWVGEWKYRVPFFHAKVRAIKSSEWVRGRENEKQPTLNSLNQDRLWPLDYDALALRQACRAPHLTQWLRKSSRI